MTACNATLTTATVTDPLWEGAPSQPWTHVIPDGWTVKRDGDRLLKVDLYTLTCHRSEGHDGSRPSDTYIGVHRGDGVEWDDDTEGATQHTPAPAPTSTVTEAEWAAVDKAMSAGCWDYKENRASRQMVREALEAAAAVRRTLLLGPDADARKGEA